MVTLGKARVTQFTQCVFVTTLVFYLFPNFLMGNNSKDQTGLFCNLILLIIENAYKAPVESKYLADINSYSFLSKNLILVLHGIFFLQAGVECKVCTFEVMSNNNTTLTSKGIRKFILSQM